MTLDLNRWLAEQGRTIDAQGRAVAAWNRIQEKATRIVVLRENATLAAQTVRLEISNAQSLGELEGSSGAAARQLVLVFGVIGHPLVADTNLQHGDRFAVDGKQYRVISVIKTHGELQATCEALS